MKIICCVFPSIDKARLAIETLTLEGYETNQINVIVQESIAKNKLFIASKDITVEQRKNEYQLNGLERMLGGKQPIQTPDAGYVLCSGADAVTVVKFAKAKSDKGFKSALTEYNIPDSIAEYYKNAIMEGALLLWVKVDDFKAGQIVKIMEYRNGLKITSI